MASFDLIVIGSGPGGYIAAIRAAQLGLNTAIVEKDSLLGGTCLHRGCIPAKTWLETAHRFEQMKVADDYGIEGVEAKALKPNLATIVKRKGRIVHQESNTFDTYKQAMLWGLNLEKKLAAFPEPEEQVTDFIDAVKNRKKFALNEENGHRSCTLINLGKIALKLGRSLKFDPVTQTFPGDEGANALIDVPMRAPWFI